MVEMNLDPQAHSADFAVEGGCPSCGGKLDVRITPGNAAWSYCASCHWLARPLVVLSGNTLQLGSAMTAQA